MKVTGWSGATARYAFLGLATWLAGGAVTLTGAPNPPNVKVWAKCRVSFLPVGPTKATSEPLNVSWRTR
jgi:hypothetical protein